MAKELKNLTKRADNYSQWYNDLVVKADLAELSPVRGCMIIKPYGYAIWEKMQQQLDKMFKQTGVQNAYFPLLIPKSFFSREAEHVAGFAKECAVVTHYRLRSTEDGKEVEVDPNAKLDEELIIRPTSETIIWNTYKNWIHSWRDLPILCNQWCNVMRWEMRTRPFLRTSEFLWQEGHTLHETEAEAREETLHQLEVYADMCENYLAMPVIRGNKTEKEKFAGAEATYTVECLMKDHKALQGATSHYFGDKFSRAYNVTFTGRDNKLQYPFQTSWGSTTRMIGAVIMTHGDNNGLVLPPRIAPTQVVIVPIAAHKNPEVLETAKAMMSSLVTAGVRVKLDDSDQSMGWKCAEYEMRGVPIRMELGPRDLAEGNCCLVRRDNGEKVTAKIEGIENEVKTLLDTIHDNMYAVAEKNLEDNTFDLKTIDEVKEMAAGRGGFARTKWCGSLECELKMKEVAGVSSRCMPLKQSGTTGKCVCCGKECTTDIYWGVAY